MTRSFVETLARHGGPYKLYASLLPDKKGRPRGVWMPEKTEDPVESSLGLLAENPGAVRVSVWSVSEECFVLSVSGEDRGTWNRESDGWRSRVKSLRAAASAERAKAAPPPKTPQGASADVVERVIALRSSGMGYVAIERECGVAGKKGFWAWRIVKARAARKTSNR